jgi:hypothetical protein
MVAIASKSVQMCVIPAGDIITGWTHAKRTTINTSPTLATLQQAVGGLIEVVPAKWIDLSMELSAYANQINYEVGMSMSDFIKLSDDHFVDRPNTQMIVNEEGRIHDLPVNYLATYVNKGYYIARGHHRIAADVRIYGAAILFSDFILE